MQTDRIVAFLRDHKKDIYADFKVKEIGVFGSVARQEQTETSDIDFLVDFTEDASFFDLVRLGSYLEGIFQRPVDIVPKEALRPELRSSVHKELIEV
ncbi:MAG: nucleotidyltransferase family protein [Anaerolineales bacterium]|nr:nucleotidyltransferase family protein [Anaerolineales bacterium]